MNYKSQLKGWAVDRVIELWKLSGRYDSAIKNDCIVDQVKSVEDLFKEADKLAAYAYVPREDLESTAKDLFELVRNAPEGQDSIEALMGTLEHIKADRERMFPKSNGHDNRNEAVQ